MTVSNSFVEIQMGGWGWGVFELRILRGVGAQAVLEIQVEGGGKKTVPSVMGLWIFSGITHSWSLWQSDKCLWFFVTCGMKNKCMMPSSLWETCGGGMTPGYSQQYTGIIYLFLLHFREFFSVFVLQIEFMKWNIKLRYTRPLLSYGLLFLFLFWFLFWLCSYSCFLNLASGFDSNLFRVQLDFYQLQKTYQAKC